MVQAAARRSTRAAAGAARAPFALEMVKLEAAGNDFLVVLDPEPRVTARLTPSLVAAVCDRRRGVGADGLIVGHSGGSGGSGGGGTRSGAGGSDGPGQEGQRADLQMTLFNADGSQAEMSGNGIRCLVHAALDAGTLREEVVLVDTAAGLRRVAYEPRGAGAGWARVDMGPVRVGNEVESPLPRTRARLADVGNPHVVAFGDVELESLDLGSLAAAASRIAGAEVNLEVVRPGRAGADLELRVHERGVGETLACGTGTCAAAAVARTFGVVGDVVVVDNPGGRLEVRLGPHGAELGGPVHKVADIGIDEAFLRANDVRAHGEAG